MITPRSSPKRSREEMERALETDLLHLKEDSKLRSKDEEETKQGFYVPRGRLRCNADMKNNLKGELFCGPKNANVV